MSYNKPFAKSEYNARVAQVKQRTYMREAGRIFGAAVSEPFVVTDQGGERLSHVAREPIVIE